VDAVHPFAAEAGAAPEIAVDIGRDAVVEAGVAGGELVPVGALATIVPYCERDRPVGDGRRARLHRNRRYLAAPPESARRRLLLPGVV
jgi:hypothetical protein